MRRFLYVRWRYEEGREGERLGYRHIDIIIKWAKGN